MTMPGFVAEACLDRTNGSYQTNPRGGQVGPLIVPQWDPALAECMEYNLLCALGHVIACAGAVGCALGAETR